MRTRVDAHLCSILKAFYKELYIWEVAVEHDIIGAGPKARAFRHAQSCAHSSRQFLDVVEVETIDLIAVRAIGPVSGRKDNAQSIVT